MVHRVVDRVRETSTTSGTGTLTLAGALIGFQTMATALPNNGDTGFFFATDGTNWEVFLGTRASSTTLSRTTVYASSNGGSLVNFTGATKDVVGDVPARFLELCNTQSFDLASAATTDLGSHHGSIINITGTTTITSFGTGANKIRLVRFSGALTLTHNSTTLILPGAANIFTAAGDAATFVSDSSGNWRLWSYQNVGTSFTPNLTFGGSGIGVSLAGQIGGATRVGNRCLFHLQFRVLSLGGATGDAAITGLPYSSVASGLGVGWPVSFEFQKLIGGAGGTYFHAHVGPSSAVVTLIATLYDGSTASAILTHNNFTTNTIVAVAGSYPIAA